MLLGRDFGFGESGPKDELAAREAYRRGCDLGVAAGCHLWGAALFYGVGGEKDLERARELQERACAADDKGGCFLAGVMWGGGHGGEQNSTQARIRFEKACKLGHDEACAQETWMEDAWVLISLGGSVVIGAVLALICFRKRGPGAGAFIGGMVPMVALNVVAFSIDALQFVWYPLAVGATTGLGSFIGKKLLFKKNDLAERTVPTQSA